MTISTGRNLDNRINQINESLNDNVNEINQIQNILFNGNLKPYYVENMADFNFTGTGVPSGLSNYVGGNYYLGISGNTGDSFVTVKSGNIADAGTNNKWAAVIKDDNGNWTPYLVTGTDGVNKVNIYPALKTTITNGEIGNLHDVALGQHYTERGYFALAQQIYKASPRYSERNKFLKKYKATDNSGWTKIGSPYASYNYSLNEVSDSGIKTYRPNLLELYIYGDGTTQGVSMTCNILGKSGFLEAFVGDARADISTIQAEFYLDGVKVKEYTGLGKEIKRLIFPFSNATTGEIKIFIPNASVVSNMAIYDTTWWVNEKDNPDKLIPPHSRVVYLGDSWGAFHNQAITRELGRLISKDSGTEISVINHSNPGHSSKWGKAWFNEYVIKEKPTHVIIEFFVNDYNSTAYNDLPNYLAPDGNSYNMNLTKEEWKQNIKDMCSLAIANGIQPIVICPCATASTTQVIGLQDFNAYLTEGISI